MFKHFWVVRFFVVVGLGMMGFTGVCVAQVSGEYQGELFTVDTGGDNASVGGKYKGLLYSVDVPLEKWKDKPFWDDGYREALTKHGDEVPGGYWVYAYPTWYVWGEKDFVNSPYRLLTKSVRLEKTVLQVRFECHKENVEWAQGMLDVFAKALPEIEQRAGVPYPGGNPFTIYENSTVRKHKDSGPNSIWMMSPQNNFDQEGWEMLFNAVRIWNWDKRPVWITEGVADVISYELAIKHKVRFLGTETLPGYIERFRQDMRTERDLPLTRFFEMKNQFEKTVDYWQMLKHELGDDFITDCFRKNCTDKNFKLDEFAVMLTAHGVADPNVFLQGWVTPGEYLIENESYPPEEDEEPSE